MLDSAGLIKRICSALCLKEGLERAARTVHRSRCILPIKFRSFVRSKSVFGDAKTFRVQIFVFGAKK